MAITIVQPTTAGSLGPGYYVSAHNDVVGPLANDDIVRFVIQDGGGAELSTARMVNKLSSAYPWWCMGAVFDTDPYGFNYARTSRAAAGAACTLQVNWYTASGGYVGGVVSAPIYTWDPVGGLGNLMNFLAAPKGGTMGEILAAVKTTFPRTT